MPRTAAIQEPELSQGARRMLAALLFSIGLHGAIIGLLRSAPARLATTAPVVMQVALAQMPPAEVVPQPVVSEALPVPVISALAQSATSVPLAPSVTPSAVASPEPAAKELAPAAPVAPPDQQTLPQIDLPVYVDNTYYTAKEVDVHPRALQAIQPIYPEPAAASNTQGWVVLRIKLDETGKVESVKVIDASPADAFDQSALAAFRQGKFAPAQKSGRAVKSLVEIKVWFKLE